MSAPGAAGAPARAEAPAERAPEDVAAAEARAVTVARLRGGRVVEVADGDEPRVTVTSPSGRVELRVRLTDDGPVLSFERADLTLAARGALTLDCEALRVRARRDVSVEAGRDIVHDARGAVDVAGDAVRLLAREGDASVEARGDARVDGGRVLLNCAPPRG